MFSYCSPSSAQRPALGRAAARRGFDRATFGSAAMASTRAAIARSWRVPDLRFSLICDDTQGDLPSSAAVGTTDAAWQSFLRPPRRAAVARGSCGKGGDRGAACRWARRQLAVGKKFLPRAARRGGETASDRPRGRQSRRADKEAHVAAQASVPVQPPFASRAEMLQLHACSPARSRRGAAWARRAARHRAIDLARCRNRKTLEAIVDPLARHAAGMPRGALSGVGQRAVDQCFVAAGASTSAGLINAADTRTSATRARARSWAYPGGHFIGIYDGYGRRA